MKNVLLIVLDGLGDRPIKEFDNLTPLEYAKTPNLDRLSVNAACGSLYSLGVGVRPSSDVAHMALFGLDYKVYYTGRGPLELIGLNAEMNDGDLAWRGNFCTLDGDIIVDRRIKRNNPPQSLLDKLKKIVIDDVTFELHHIAEHRFALRAIGKNLSADINDTDPHIEGVPPLEIIGTASACAERTAGVVKKYIKRVSEICNSDADAVKLGVNGVLLRGVGVKPHWPTLKDSYQFMRSCCIANNALYNGVASSLGMKLKNIKHYCNYEDYYTLVPQLVRQALPENDFVFLHMQEGDLFGEDGNFRGKKKAIEQIDKALSFLNEIDLTATLVVVTADHSTPCALKAHSGDSVPLMMAGDCVRADSVTAYGERACSNGILGTVMGKDLMQLMLNYLGKAPLIGG